MGDVTRVIRGVQYGNDYREVDLRKALVSIDCETFHGVMLSDKQVALLLSLVAKANINERWKNGIDSVIRNVLGDNAEAIRRYMELT